MRKEKIIGAALLVIVAHGGGAAADETQIKLNLKEAVALALSRNSDLAIARMRKAGADERKREILGKAYPDLDLSASYRYEGNVQSYEIAPGQSIQFQPTDNYSYGANISQWIYSGSVWAGLKGARHLVSAAEHHVFSSKNNVIANVKIKFFTVLYERELIRVNEESVEQSKRHLEDSRAREKVGLGASYDTMRFETRLAEAIPGLIGAKNNYDRAVTALLDSVGVDPMKKAELTGTLEYKPVSITLGEAMETAIQKRPSLAEANEKVLLAEQITRAAKGELAPTLEAFGAYQRSNSELGPTGDFNWRNEWNLGLRLELNLFDGRERSSRIGRRKVEEHIARLEQEKMLRTVKMQVKNAYNELNRAREFVESQIKSVDYASETYRIINERHKEGMATQLELLDAQVALTRIKINHSRSLFEYSRGRARLEFAMGVEDIEEM